MKFLRILGWVCIPFIMVIISWRKLGKAPKVVAIIWSILLILFIAIPTEDQEKQLAETKTTEEVGKPSVQSEPSEIDGKKETKTIDWKTEIKKIAASDQSETEKFDQLELELVNNYTPSEEELNAFENEIISAFKNKEYLNDITDAEYMLTNIFKSSVIVSSYEDKNEPMSKFAFDFWQNSKYTYRGADAVDSQSVKANEDQMERALKEIKVVQEDMVEKKQADMNTVYGELDKSNYKQNSDILFRDEERDVLYLLADDKIFQAEKNLDTSLGINIGMDKSFLTDHAFDYMAEDASLVQTINDSEFVYESKELGKKYDVLFVSDTGDNVISRVIVSQHLQ